MLTVMCVLTGLRRDLSNLRVSRGDGARNHGSQNMGGYLVLTSFL